MENNRISADPLLKMIWKRRVLFIVVGLIAAVVSAAVSFIVPEKYKAVASMLPSKSSSQPLGDRLLPPHGVEMFGEEAESQRMLALLNSAATRNAVIAKFNLGKRYDVDPKSKTALHEIKMNFAENFNFERNRYGAVDIVVWDRSPDTAAMMANYIITLFDSVTNKMIGENALRNYLTVKKEYDVLQQEIKTVEDTLSALKSLGVVGEEEALAALLERQTLAMQKGGAFAEEVNKVIENNSKFGGTYMAYYSKMGFLMKRNEVLKGNMDQTFADSHSSMAHKFVVDPAEIPQKKAYPVRWFMVMASTIASLFFVLALLVILQKIRELNSAA